MARNIYLQAWWIRLTRMLSQFIVTAIIISSAGIGMQIYQKLSRASNLKAVDGYAFAFAALLQCYACISKRINPMLSITQYFTEKFDYRRLLMDLFAQLAGAYLGFYWLKQMTTEETLRVMSPARGFFDVLGTEFFLMFLLMLSTFYTFKGNVIANFVLMIALMVCLAQAELTIGHMNLGICLVLRYNDYTILAHIFGQLLGASAAIFMKWLIKNNILIPILRIIIFEENMS